MLGKLLLQIEPSEITSFSTTFPIWKGDVLCVPIAKPLIRADFLLNFIKIEITKFFYKILRIKSSFKVKQEKFQLPGVQNRNRMLEN